ncbi:alpha/beta fold hydrolase [Amycolatopsis sp. PS_44_ISF1]|uniref:alpha/beta fold hydrolase n=1 Tax=Amycolatopsis sp. PS_44_ISF1 TaxID=2974917 RepID=UPI0028DE9292|nr:alpha/beta fold hydrolase [Amycolatopsis sp. PS_44_ISF1]MDT8913700.1 alpha/beta hydrolase [Amycolatopsis sp. PS_44_ISF1]
MSLACHVERSRSPSIDPVLVIGGVLQGRPGWSVRREHVLPLADLMSVDVPGFVVVSPTGAGPSIDHLCQVVTALLDDLGVTRVNFFGYSLGSLIAYRFAQRSPARVARLALGGVPLGIASRLISHLELGAARTAGGEPQALAESLADAFLEPVQSQAVRNGEVVHRLVRRLLVRAMSTTVTALPARRYSVTRELDPAGGLDDVPTLVFCGVHDTLGSPAQHRRFAANISDCRFAVVGDADHWIFLERREDTSDLVMRHFTGQSLAQLSCLVDFAAGDAIANTG